MMPSHGRFFPLPLALLLGGCVPSFTTLPPDGGGSDGGGGSGAGGSAATSTSGTGGAGGCPLAPFSDDFEAPSTLPCWTAFEPTASQASTVIVGGQLVMTPTPTLDNGWFTTHRGALLSQPVTGNFLLIAAVSAGTAASASTPPTGDFNTAGLIARAPGSIETMESWVLIDVGYQDDGDNSIGNVGLGVMAKTTTHSVTTRTAIAVPEVRGLLAICRTDAGFHMIRRLVGEASASVVISYPPSESLPATLDVGLVAGSYNAPHELIARFDFTRFVPDVTTVNACLVEVDEAFPTL